MMWNPSVNAIWLRAGSSSEEAARVVRTVSGEMPAPTFRPPQPTDALGAHRYSSD